LTEAALEPAPFEVDLPGHRLRGEVMGAGTAIVLCHGLTATRRYVVHGSRLLPRRGFQAFSYDARGHGESDPAPHGGGYAYAELAADLAALVEQLTEGRPYVLAGHSMGAHTLTAHALAAPERIAALVVIGPTYVGSPLTDEQVAYWEALADGLERGGVDGFIAAYDHGLNPEWRETILRITRDRLARHRHPQAVAQALREVPVSAPFERLDELEFLDVPALVVASHDDADRGHPFSVAEQWAERLPRATLVSEDEGASPLAWQGGRLSREIAAFCERPEVASRLRA
jgi:pimeloyl-ACP methyl ester carboxylesterase